MNFRCPTDQGIALHSSVFVDLVPSHVSLAQIQTSDGRVIQQLFTKDIQTLAVSGRNENMRDAGFLKYVQMGIMHIFTGVDPRLDALVVRGPRSEGALGLYEGIGMTVRRSDTVYHGRL